MDEEQISEQVDTPRAWEGVDKTVPLSEESNEIERMEADGWTLLSILTHDDDVTLSFQREVEVTD